MKRKVAKFRLMAKRVSASIGAIVPKACEQLFFFFGLGSVVFGCWMVYKPLGFIVGGLLLFWLSTLISAERSS